MSISSLSSGRRAAATAQTFVIRCRWVTEKRQGIGLARHRGTLLTVEPHERDELIHRLFKGGGVGEESFDLVDVCGSCAWTRC